MMKDIMFGELLEKLLYLSNQQKGSLAKELGYDVSYISKWINSKNLPSSKNANLICRNIATFIIDSLDDSTADDIIKYFEFDMDDDKDKKECLFRNIEKSLKQSYLINTGNLNKHVIKQDTYSQEKYNSNIFVNPSLKKKLLQKDIVQYIEAGESLDAIIYADMFNIPIDDKLSIAKTKNVLNKLNIDKDLRIRYLTGFKYSDKDFLINSFIILHMLTSYPDAKFKIYNCDVSRNTGLVAIKDKTLYMGIFKEDGTGFVTTTSKEKEVANQMYYSLENMLETKDCSICNKIMVIDLIARNTYMEYMMGQNMKWLLGSMSELFMPEDLFIEIANELFGHNDNIMNKIKEINVFLNRVTYKRDLKVLLYECEIRKYISSGRANFFGVPITLTFEQRKRHMKYLEEVIKKASNIEVKIIKKKLIDDISEYENPTMLISKNLKLIKLNYIKEKTIDKAEYLIAKDSEFKNMCNDLFDEIWSYDKELLTENKDFILNLITNSIEYMSIITENTNQ